MKLSTIGEVKVIEAIINLVKDIYPNEPLPLYDDAVAVKIGDSWVIIKIDGTNSRSSRYPWMGWDNFGYRVALSTVSDIISKGGKPLGLSTSIGVPSNFTINEVLKLIEGIKELLTKVGARFLGGDLNASSINDYVWIDVSGIGIAEKPIPNKFKDGDLIRVSKCLGFSAIEALTFYRNIDIKEVRKYIKIPYNPEPPLNFLNICKHVTAATDVSDGLYSLTKILSRLRLDLILSNDLPLCNEVVKFMDEFSISLVDVLKYLGEEYVIVFNDPQGVLGEYPLLGKLRKGRGNIVYEGKVVHGGWDNFKGFMG